MRRHRTVPRSRFSLHATSWLLCALTLGLSANNAFAHRPNESTAQLRWQHQRLECELILPLSLASIVLNDPAVPLINSENFPGVRERLQLRLIETFRVEVRDRTLTPVSDLTTVTLNADGEVLCSLVFPQEAPGPLRVHASFLQSASPDSFCWVRLWSEADRVLGQKLLVRSAPRADFTPVRPESSTAPPPP
ncbi:MAG: hypothetical protein QM760_22185 [Nibricoccus sp.]